MFALINAMEMAIKINTTIILETWPTSWGWSAKVGRKKREKVVSLVKKHEKGVKSITLRGEVRQETFSHLLSADCL